MKTMIFCEGTTDLLMIQYVLQYKYGWHYNGFLENAETNRLRKKTLKRDTDIVDIESCGGIMNIPKRMQELQEQIDAEEERSKEIDSLEEYVGTDEYIEQTAKDKLNLVHENEIIFKKK